MAKFLFTVWPFRSHYFPMVAMALALRERGHEVAFYSGSTARPDIEGEGFRSFEFRNVDEERVHELMFRRSAYASWKLPRQLKTLLRDWLLGTVPDQVLDLEPILAEWQPDVIVSETSLWAPMLVLHERHGLPVAIFSTVAACLLPGPEIPLVGLGLPRPRSWSSRTLSRLARSAVDLLSRDFRHEVDKLRRDHGLPGLGTSVTEFSGQMPLYLVPSTPEFDFERQDLPPSVHYIGACLWNRPSRENPPAWLELLTGERPCVHVTEGTMHTQEPVLLRAAVEGLANLPIDVILTTGGHRSPSELGLGEIAPNIRIESWVSHELLLPHVDLLVTTGGAGTVMTALQAGVPLIVVPTEWDKPENAQRVVEAGAGLRIAPSRCTPARLRSAVERILAEPAFREKARHMGSAFAGYGGPRRAAELLEELAGHRPTQAEMIPDQASCIQGRMP